MTETGASLPRILASYKIIFAAEKMPCGNDMAALVKMRIAKYPTTPFEEQMKAILDRVALFRKSAGPTSQADRATKLCRAGLYSKATAAMLGSPILEWSPNVLDKFRSKFPEETADTTAPASDEDDAQEAQHYSASAVRQAIASFRKGSAAGAAGWSPDILKRLIALPGRGDRVVGALAKILPALRSTEGELRRVIYGGRGLPLDKGAGDVRPIVVPDTFRRLGAKVVMAANAEAIEAVLVAHHQCGVLLKRGAEITCHAIRILADAHPDLIAIKVDCSNAFNSVSRKAIRAALAKHLPQLGPYFREAYGHHSSCIQCGTDVVECTRGGLQGDPLMPTLFAAALIDGEVLVPG